VGEVRTELASAGLCIVVFDSGVVAGSLTTEALGAGDDEVVDAVMDSGPRTVRPSEESPALAERMQKKGLAHMVVTRPDGRLVGSSAPREQTTTTQSLNQGTRAGSEVVSDYGRELQFAVNVDPSAAALETGRAIARRADAAGLELVGIQDHPYQHRFLDTWMLMATLLASTERVRLFPNVTSLPLRGAAMIAKQAASLDVLSDGRFELGIGAGGFWDAIAAMGGPRREPRDALEALQDAIQIIRLFWSGQRTISYTGRHYAVKGLHPGPPSKHPIGIWVGGAGPRMLQVIGRDADGWIPSFGYVTPELVPAKQQRIDEAARAAGRSPAEIRRIYNLMGEITEVPTQARLKGPPSHWIEELTGFAVELGFDTFVFWSSEDHLHQLDRFVGEVVPAVREAVARERGDSSADAGVMPVPSNEDLLRIYRETKTIAVVGASADEAKPAHAIPAYLQSQGYRIVPVNPRGGELFGDRVYRSLRDVDVPVDVIDVFRPPTEAEEVAREAIALGAKTLWFQPGTHTSEAVRLASRAGLTVVWGLCMGATHGALGLGPGPHAAPGAGGEERTVPRTA
jgi:alkanesulfonate monooxygenase SsuD/methylene tetrahydromethanopterin reductase-like flavin-dependent oxidoreductase (luciferase family)